MSPSATPSISKITASRRPPFSAKLKAISMEISLSSVAEKLSLTLSVFPSQTPFRLLFFSVVSPLLFLLCNNFSFLPDLPLQPTLQQQPPFSSRPSLSTTLQPSQKHSSNGQTTFTGVNPWLLLQATNLIPHQPTMHGHVAPWDCDTWQNQAAENEPPNGGLQRVIIFL